MKKIFTNGCFDILHRGHFELLKYCKNLGHVVVGINTDDSVKRLKGPARPFFSQKDRIFMLDSCKYVDEVILFNEDTPYKGVAEIIIGKQRNGPIGTCRLSFVGKFTRFEDLSPDAYQDFDDE